jgi:hypothetical protein
MTIIGICGFQSSGKDTVAQLLINKYGYHKLSFGGAIKDVVATLFDWSRDKLEGLTEDDRKWRETVDEWWAVALDMPNLTPRFVLQYFGTDLFRKHWNEDFWVKVVEKKLSAYENVVVTDCRYANEIALITKNNGIIIQVHRQMPDWFDIYKNGEDVADAKKLHSSETNWIRCKYDVIIQNTGTISDLHSNIERLGLFAQLTHTTTTTTTT